MANGKMFDAAGKVETIEADFNNETGNLAFRATFANPDGLLRHGETGKILMTSQLRPDRLAFPSAPPPEPFPAETVHGHHTALLLPLLPCRLRHPRRRRERSPTACPR